MANSKNSLKDLRTIIITVSDSRSAKTKEDVSGKFLKELVESVSRDVQSPEDGSPPTLSSGSVANYVIPDDLETIRIHLEQCCDVHKADLVLTVGGTGFAERDVTPEATKSILVKEAPGLVTALLNRSMQSTPLAALSRLACGIRGRTLVVNFPGSVKAVKECWEVLRPLLPHAIDLIRGNSEKAEQIHQQLGQESSEQVGDQAAAAHDSHRHHHHSHSHGDASKSSVQTTNVASRPRESPFPMITFEQAMKQVLDQASTIPSKKIRVNLLDALNHILAEDVVAPDPQPPFPASIKDGYAVVASDGAGERLVLKTVSTAGIEKLLTMKPGMCIRISTGAPVPLGADAVVQVEDTTLLEEKDGEEIKILIRHAPVPGQDIRPIGCDVMGGQIVVEHGVLVTSAEIGLLASVGASRVFVYDWPNVALLSTGDELTDPLRLDLPVDLPYGKIRDTNRPELISLLLQCGITPTSILNVGICPDEPYLLKETLRIAFNGEGGADVLVTTGGVSMGERDLLKQILVEDFGFQLHFARVQMKPGKPTTFASGIWSTGTESKRVLVFGLPGNPVSAWVTAQLYVLPAIRQIAGYDVPQATVIPVKMAEDIQLDPRPEFARAILVPPDTSAVGDYVASAVLTDSNQMSSRLLSNRQANLLLMLPPKTLDKSKVSAGEIVQAMVIGRL